MCSPWTWRWCPPRREHRATPSHTSVTNPTFLHPYTVPRHLDKHRDTAIVWPNSPVIANLVHQTIIQICEVVTVVHGKGRVFNCIATWKFFNSVEMSSRSSLDVFRAEVEDRVRRRMKAAAAGVMVPSVSMLPCLTLHSPWATSYSAIGPPPPVPTE